MTGNSNSIKVKDYNLSTIVANIPHRNVFPKNGRPATERFPTTDLHGGLNQKLYCVIDYLYFAIIANILLPYMLAMVSSFCNQAHWANREPEVARASVLIIKPVHEKPVICVRAIVGYA